MNFDLSEGESAWRDEVRAFLRANVTEALLAELRTSEEDGLGPARIAFDGQVAARGWNALTWPKEHGGLAMGPLFHMLLTEEFLSAGVPPIGLTATMLAPVIIRYGSTANKDDWLPGIKQGTTRFALGYSEPDAGTDLAALRTRATLDGDEWVINGQKSWNSHAHTATHEWLAVRTSRDLAAHQGISIIIVPIDAQGVDVVPVRTWGDVRTNDVFFTDVRVPRTNLIGDVNHGWRYIVGALDNERAVLGSTASLRKLLDELIDACNTVEMDGRLVAERPIVRRQLAELAMELEVAALLSLDIASSMESGTAATVPATMQKVMTTELRTKIADLGMSMFGLGGHLRYGDPLSPVEGQLEWTYRQAPFWRFGGGTNEVMRDIIAQRGRGLPRATRR
jgi:alkylation response protein AidB-like acyl-CoA dehydrogenase